MIINVNNTEIHCPQHEGQNYVAIKPICEILGIDSDRQIARIKEDEILGQLPLLVGVVGKDKKTREMLCLPVKYIFGWLFSINANRLKIESKPTFIRYKQECYEALYSYFFKKISTREELLADKARIIKERRELELRLNTNEDYARLQDLRIEESRISKPLHQMDRDTIAGQLNLFQD